MNHTAINPPYPGTFYPDTQTDLESVVAAEAEAAYEAALSKVTPTAEQLLLEATGEAIWAALDAKLAIRIPTSRVVALRESLGYARVADLAEHYEAIVTVDVPGLVIFSRAEVRPLTRPDPVAEDMRQLQPCCA